MSSLIARLLDRGADILESIDFNPGALRRDLGGQRVSPGRLYSAAELIGHAADLCSDSAGLVRDNERRWRVFRQRVSAIVAVEPDGTIGPVGSSRSAAHSTNDRR